MTKHVNIKISGPRVQGIGFRFSAYEKYVELGLEGRAENTNDGGLFLDVEGPEDKLSMLLEWCYKGPSGARVSQVETVEVSEPFVPLKNG